MANIIIYTQANCPYCEWAKRLLETRGATWTEIRIDLETEQRKKMENLSGRRTTPQIFINDKPIGGYDDLAALSQSGQLTALLQNH